MATCQARHASYLEPVDPAKLATYPGGRKEWEEDTRTFIAWMCEEQFELHRELRILNRMQEEILER